MINFGEKKPREYLPHRCRNRQASCTFVRTKVTCRLLRIGAISSLLRSAKESPGNINHINLMNQKPKLMNLKTKKLQIRLTEDEFAYIKEHSINYSSMSHYIRSTIKEYSDPSAALQLRLTEALGRFYRDNREDLSKVSVCLNKAVKRANELALSGHLTQTYFSETLMPQIIRTRIFLESLSRQLPSLTKLASK